MAKRTTVTMSPKLEEMIDVLAKEESTSKTEIIRRAIAFYNYVYRETHEKKNKIVVTSSTGEPQQVILVGITQ